MFKKCDRDHNGVLDDKEFFVYSLHTGKSAGFWESVDPTYTGVVDASALAKLEDSSKAEARRQVDRELCTNAHTRRTGDSIERFYPSGQSIAKNPRDALAGIQVARTYEQITTDPEALENTKASKDAFTKAEPALFSYGHDYVNHADTWQASGVVAYPIKLGPEFGIAPSIAFNRLQTNNKGGVDQSSLISRLQYTQMISDFLGTRSTTIRGNAFYNTDFDFDKESPGGELDIQPTTGIIGNERFSYLIPGIKWRWDAFLHVEGGAMLRSNAKDGSDDQFIRFGPKVELDAYVLLNPSNLDDELNNRIHLAINYNYYVAFGSTRDSRLLRASVNVYLDKEHHLSLTAEYDNGYAPLENKKTDSVLTALGVKF